jgi:glycosyltransferase involved in cell wall biosynthesis
MPVYNGLRGKGSAGEFILREAIESILNQTVYDQCEFVVVDDGSNDNTFWVLQEYAGKHPEIHILHFTENYGVTHAVNAGIHFLQNECECFDYMCMQGADDISHPERVKTMMDWMDRHTDVAMAGCWSEAISWDGQQVLRRICDVPRRHNMLFVDAINGKLDHNVRFPMVRWQVGEEAGWFDEYNFPRRAQDADFLLRVAENYKVGTVPALLYRYRMPSDEYQNCLSYDTNTHERDLVRALAMSEHRRNTQHKEINVCQTMQSRS